MSKPILMIGFAAVLLSASSASATVAVVNFDDLTTGPDVFSGLAQTISTAPAVFTGGMIVGNPIFLPQTVFATAPNLYGAASFDPNLSETLTISVNNTFSTTELSFILINGMTSTVSYLATAFSGATSVASQTLTNISSNQSTSGFGLVDLINAGGITKVEIAPVGLPTGFDFFIDTIAFNESIQTAINSPSPGGVPESSTWAMMLLGFGGIGVMAYRRKNKATFRFA
jgi:hypothetical protein